MLQATLNQDMIVGGINRYQAAVTTAKERHEESTTKYGRQLLSGCLGLYREAIDNWIAKADGNGGGRRHGALKFMKGLPSGLLAFIGARSFIDDIGNCRSYTSSVYAAGACVEGEIRFEWLAKNHPGLFKKLDRQLGHCMSYDRKKAVIVHAMNKAGLTLGSEHEKATPGDVFVPWTRADRTCVGIILLDLFVTSTGFIQTHIVGKGRRSKIMIQATDKLVSWINQFNDHNEVLNPMWMPTVEAPAKWTGAYAGGYSGEGLPILSLVKRSKRSYLTEVLDKAVMPDVYTAINALQETPWKINVKTLNIMRHMYDVGRAVGGMPSSTNFELPEKPEDINTNEAARKEWKLRASRIYGANAALRSKRIQMGKLFALGKRFANVPKFYFPYALDFRGRIYTVPTFLTPQGPDHARALLLFADGVPMWDDADAYWLAVYGANLWGNDKVSFEDRVKWVADNEAKILAVAQDPLAYQWWVEADEPWQFLSWCFEWGGWKKVGSGFVTHLPVALDGTNNGLQVLSILTRDEVAAKATNVLPSDKPADIYADVARDVVRGLTELGTEDAKYWLALGVNRKTTKRPVMVMPYGGTLHSCKEYVRNWYEEIARERGIELPDFAAVSRKCQVLANLIWASIGNTVGLPRELMQWFQECANVFTDAGLPIRWTAPSGFPVLQHYTDDKHQVVRTRLGDGIRCVEITLVKDAEEGAPPSRSRQRNGISPNYVHSCDASALVKTVALCSSMEIKSFAMIHDSYGTHAPNVHAMSACLRKAFIDLFSDNRIQMLRDEWQAQLDAAGTGITLPQPPALGNLDLNQLKDSEFFFA